MKIVNSRKEFLAIVSKDVEKQRSRVMVFQQKVDAAALQLKYEKRILQELEAQLAEFEE